jgi:hypothetical protein
MPASNSATLTICCSMNLPVGPSIAGKSPNSTSTPARSSQECPMAAEKVPPQRSIKRRVRSSQFLRDRAEPAPTFGYLPVAEVGAARSLPGPRDNGWHRHVVGPTGPSQAIKGTPKPCAIRSDGLAPLRPACARDNPEVRDKLFQHIRPSDK